MPSRGWQHGPLQRRSLPLTALMYGAKYNRQRVFRPMISRGVPIVTLSVTHGGCDQL
jgi:hypothetical protein